ncbi:MAG: L-threonylcarbamoyladenylate synthase [Trueperaceae bacterium]
MHSNALAITGDQRDNLLRMIVAATPENLARAVLLLRQGELVAFPTETVYGLGADARNPKAVKKIFDVKGRPSDHPVIVHLTSAAQFKDWAIAVPNIAYQLAKAFMPGALTLILQRSKNVPNLVTGGQDTVGLRVPSHPVAQALLQTFGGGIAAPSANRFGKISPTTAGHVLNDLGEDVPLILDGGACEVGLESTILDVTSAKVNVLRPGGISLEALTHVLGYTPDVLIKAKVRVSGALDSHYAPSTPAFLVTKEILKNVTGQSGVISLQEKPKGFTGGWLQLPNHATDYGQRLYAALRELDEGKFENIFIEQVPETSDWLAVRDRLKRAAKKQ